VSSLFLYRKMSVKSSMKELMVSYIQQRCGMGFLEGPDDAFMSVHWQATLVTHSFEDVKQEEHRTAITDSYTIVHSAGSSSHSRMARKKIREFDSKRILKEHLKRLAGISVDIKSAQVESPILFELYDCKMMQ